MKALTHHEKDRYDRALKGSGIRSTRQREHVYSVILEKPDHPTADELYARARESMPTISLATVYNCLETLVHTQLVRQVNLERGATRYCPNRSMHAHFHCQKSGEIFDIPIPEETLSELTALLPDGFEAEHFDLSFTGRSGNTEPVNRNKGAARPTQR